MRFSISVADEEHNKLTPGHKKVPLGLKTVTKGHKKVTPGQKKPRAQKGAQGWQRRFDPHWVIAVVMSFLNY